MSCLEDSTRLVLYRPDTHQSVEQRLPGPALQMNPGERPPPRPILTHTISTISTCCLQELRALLHQQSTASSAALDAERAAAAQQADESAAAAAESAQEAAAAALHAAEVRAALLEGQLEAAEQERDALQQQVRRVKGLCIAQHSPALLPTPSIAPT